MGAGMEHTPDLRQPHQNTSSLDGIIVALLLALAVIVAPLGTVILQFLLNNVVAGGASCGF